MTATRWELERNHWPGQLGLRNLNDKRSITYALRRLADGVAPKLVGKTGIPAFWQLESKHRMLTFNVEHYANIYDTGGFRLGRFKLADSFMEELNGRHRRTPAQVYSSAHTTSGGGSGGTFTGRSTVTSTFWPTPEPKPIENAGIRAGEIVGHRCWRVIDGYLHSAYVRGHRWPPRHPLRAVGMTDYVNGIYALTSAAEATRAAVDYIHEDHFGIWKKTYATPFVTGTCYLWGDVVEHDKGWRVSFAMVKSIDAVVTGDVDLEALRERYGV